MRKLCYICGISKFHLAVLVFKTNFNSFKHRHNSYFLKVSTLCESQSVQSVQVCLERPINNSDTSPVAMIAARAALFKVVRHQI